ncbi:lysin [Bacillus cereus]|uniref:Lysin n=1 Tax=Bacillus cereus TaxID=1396 RepID=A0A9X9AC07_BACCE|nr:lysin [Bacillus cereus]
MYKVTIINENKQTVIHDPFFNPIKVQTGVIKSGINVASGFTFSLLPNNPGYKLIRPLRTLVKVYNLRTQQLEFDGRILSPTEGMDSSGKITKIYRCESELGYLNDSIQRYGEYHNMGVKRFLELMLQNHNRDVDGDDINKIFKIGNVEITGNLYRYLGYEHTLDTIFDKLIERLGGEIRVRKERGVRYLDYAQEFGEIKETPIELSKNLKSIKREVDPSAIITRLVPLGQAVESEDETATAASPDRLTIRSVNNGIEYIEDEIAKSIWGNLTKNQIWDDITLASNLKSAGERFLKENNRIKIQYVITALDLSLIASDVDSFEIGNYHPVINPIMGINEYLRIVEKTIDIINPNENSLKVGDVFKTSSQYQAEMTRSQRNVVTDIQGRVLQQSSKIGSLSSTVSVIKEEIGNADLQGIIKELKNMELAINKIQEDLENIPTEESISKIKESIENVDERLQETETAVEEVGNIVQLQGESIEKLDERLTTLENGGESNG